jgi:hypothetical protein
MGSVGTISRRLLMMIIGGVGLAWGFANLAASETSDNGRALESNLLRSQTYNQAGLKQTFDNWAAQDLSACDTHSQRALLLMDLLLSQTALQSGKSALFDQHLQSLEARSKEILKCAPRDSFVWMLLFDLNALYGQTDEKSFDLLKMSYDTSPNEAWISIRRLSVALPLLFVMRDALRDTVLSEFQQLIRSGFANEAARSYSMSSALVRSSLQTRIEQLTAAEQDAFSSALKNLQSKSDHRATG